MSGSQSADDPMDTDPPGDLEEDSEGEGEVDSEWEQFEDANGDFLWKLTPSFNDTGISKLEPKFRPYVRTDDKYIRLIESQFGNAIIEDKAINDYIEANPKVRQISANIRVLYISATLRPLIENKNEKGLGPYPYDLQALAYRSWDGSPGLAVSGNTKTRGGSKGPSRSIIDLG